MTGRNNIELDTFFWEKFGDISSGRAFLAILVPSGRVFGSFRLYFFGRLKQGAILASVGRALKNGRVWSRIYARKLRAFHYSMLK